MQRQWKIWVWNVSWVDVSMCFQKGQEEENPTGRGLQLGPFPEMEWTNTQVRVVKLAVRCKWGKQIVSELLLCSFASFSPPMLPCTLKGLFQVKKKYFEQIIPKMLWHARYAWNLSYMQIKLKTVWAIRKTMWVELTFDIWESQWYCHSSLQRDLPWS